VGHRGSAGTGLPLALLLLGGLTFSACGESGAPRDLSNADRDFQEQLQLRLLDARPGDVIEIPEGVFAFDRGLRLTVDGVTIRGAGMDRTVLNFAEQAVGADGLLVTGNDFTIEELAIEDTPGDGLKVSGAENVIIRRVRVEWTRGPSTRNGAYGIYPVLSRNVLIEESVAIGASDAGIYVGQSGNAVIRRNRVEFNVAGIEVENTVGADVYGNTATRNTGGILVFNMPNLPQPGHTVRVFRNRVEDNNTRNFGHEGTPVASIPAGSGVVVNSNDRVEIFDNDIARNRTANVIVSSVYSTGFSDLNVEEGFDPYPEAVFIHGNRFEGGGNSPDLWRLQVLRVMKFGIRGRIPDVLWDGWVDEEKLVDGVLPEELRLCVDNGEVEILNIDEPGGNQNPRLVTDEHRCRHDPLPPVELPFSGSLPEARFHSGAPPQELAEWGMLALDGRRLVLAKGAVPYDLNTALFSDYAHKLRTVWVQPGTVALSEGDEVLDFPVGTVLTKTFYYPRASGGSGRAALTLDDMPGWDGAGLDLDRVHLIETRILVRREEGWAALPYLWDEGQTGARLARTGALIPLDLVDARGRTRPLNYLVPNTDECGACHVTDAGDREIRPIGPRPRHLNRDFPYADGSENQLARLAAMGYLETSGKPAEAPRAARWTGRESLDAIDLEDAVRSYLDINCAHCHSPGGPGRTSGLRLTPDEPLGLGYGMCKPPVAAGAGTGGRRFSIVPGRPEASIFIHRMETGAPAIMMPELGRSTAHVEAIELVDRWIRGLEGDCG
jgi:parallel beta-helix repeat protein